MARDTGLSSLPRTLSFYQLKPGEGCYQQKTLWFTGSSVRCSIASFYLSVSRLSECELPEGELPECEGEAPECECELPE